MADLEVEAKAADASKGTAMRQLRQIFVRLTKGELRPGVAGVRQDGVLDGERIRTPSGYSRRFSRGGA